jgi:hypothetical protein
MSNIKKYNDFISEAVFKEQDPVKRRGDYAKRLQDLSDEDLKKRKEAIKKQMDRPDSVIGQLNRDAKAEKEKANEFISEAWGVDREDRKRFEEQAKFGKRIIRGKEQKTLIAPKNLTPVLKKLKSEITKLKKEHKKRVRGNTNSSQYMGLASIYFRIYNILDFANITKDGFVKTYDRFIPYPVNDNYDIDVNTFEQIWARIAQDGYVFSHETEKFPTGNEYLSEWKEKAGGDYQMLKFGLHRGEEGLSKKFEDLLKDIPKSVTLKPENPVDLDKKSVDDITPEEEKEMMGSGFMAHENKIDNFSNFKLK